MIAMLLTGLSLAAVGLRIGEEGASASTKCANPGTWCLYTGPLAKDAESGPVAPTATNVPFTATSVPPTATNVISEPKFIRTAFCTSDPVCASGSSPLRVGLPIYASFDLDSIPETRVYAQGFWNAEGPYTEFYWEPPFTELRFAASNLLGIAASTGVVTLHVWVGDDYVGSFGAQVEASTQPTATPTKTPTPFPTLPTGGGISCIAQRQTLDWHLCVRDTFFFGDLFEVRVTPLTAAALNSSYRVRVDGPDFLWDDSSLQFPFAIGFHRTLQYPSDFLVFGARGPGLYEVELRVDFLRETSVTVFVD